MMGKLLDEMRRNPRGDWTIADVERLCREHNLRCTPPSGGGSHYKVSHGSLSAIMTIPRRRPIKPVYIRKLVEMVARIGDLR